MMSTDYRPLTPIRMAELFDGRLERVGVWEHHPEAEIAKKLVENDPALVLPINKDKLRNEIKSRVRMLSTDEDDLPCA
jgi:hypothetical protein